MIAYSHMTYTESDPPASEKPTNKNVLLCACSGAGWIDREKMDVVRTALLDAGHTVECVPDLCRIAAKEPERLHERISGQTSQTIVACYPRAVMGLLAQAGIHPPEESVDVVNARTSSTTEVMKALDLEPPRTSADEDVPSEASADEWVPWFPVIDQERCIDCLQCLNFCLFGVYGEDEEGRVQVKNPEACKTNCPACARICPEAAIMFPKYPHDPINGEEVGDLSSDKEKIQVDMDKLIQGNVHAALAARKFKRQQMALLRKEQETS